MQLQQRATRQPSGTSAESEISEVHKLYTSLSSELDLDAGLGGKLLFAGALDEPGIQLVRAANIAGAASLSASADQAMQRTSIREGVADFLVTSLDEALRILKNEIRKRQGVSVSVAAPPDLIAEEMQKRGVLPDLLPRAEVTSRNPSIKWEVFVGQGARRIEVPELPAEHCFCVLPVSAEWARRTAELDDLILDWVPQSDHVARRWLRLAPRYLGPQARKLRSVGCDRATAARLMALI